MRDAGGDVLAFATADAGGVLAHSLEPSCDLNAAVMPAATPEKASSEPRVANRTIRHSLFAILFLLAGDRLGRSLARARIGVGALTAHRQAATMAQATVAAEIHQPLDV